MRVIALLSTSIEICKVHFIGSGMLSPFNSVSPNTGAAESASSVTATVCGSTWFLPFWMVSLPVPSAQVRASEHRSPTSARTPTMARSRAARRWAVSALIPAVLAAAPGEAQDLADLGQGVGLAGCRGSVAALLTVSATTG